MAQRPAADNFSTLFEFLPIGAYRSSPQGTQLRANPALARMNGFATEAEQLAARCDIAGRWYVDPQRRAEFMRQMVQHGQVVAFESEVYRYKTRERIWISENAHLVRDERGRALFYEGTVEDISSRVSDRAVLQASQQQMLQIMEMVPGMVYQVALLPGGQRQATFISGGVRELLGLEPEDILADGMLLHRLRHPDDRARIEAETEAANAARRPLHIEFRVVLPTGQIKWVQVLSAAAPAADTRNVRVGVVVDITAAKQAENLRMERDGAAAADLAKSAFLSRVSHELRTPLNAVLGFAQLMALDPGHSAFSQRQLGWTRQILASGRHLTALMDDLLDLSSAQTGQLRFNLTAVALRPLIEEACTMLSGAAATAGVQLLQAPPADPALALLADRKRLLQVLGNLLSNAIKYNRPGGWVRVQAVRLAGHQGAQGQASDEVELQVADSGPGLDAGQRARLFQPFERLNAHAGPIAGTGLGLALSRQFVEAMGGRIRVDSEPGQGAVFSLRLPRVAPESGAAAADTPAD
jgi:PAS domain S-box-containing protein